MGRRNSRLMDPASSSPRPDGPRDQRPEPRPAPLPRSSGLREATTPDVASFNPGSHNMTDVLTYVAEHPDEREAVLEAERAGKARVSLLSALEE